MPDQLSIRLALRWAFETFRSNFLAFLALAGVVTALRLVQPWAAEPFTETWLGCASLTDQDLVAACVSESAGMLVMNGAISALLVLVTLFATIGVYRAALRSTLGQPPSLADMLTTQYLGKYVLVLMVQVALVLAGLVIFVFPGLLIALFIQFAHLFTLDKGYGVVEAIRASFTVIGRNLGPALLMTAIAVLLALPSAFFAIATLVSLPMFALFTAHMYRQFNRESISG